MKKGLFITVEGTDGSGKTTQIRLIEEYLRHKGYKVVLTREPGGTNISEKIRSITLDAGNTEMGAITEMLLYASARAQLVSEVIKPAIDNGAIVICDRFIDSSLVYQGFGRGIDLEVVMTVNRVAMNGIFPDITLFFDISPQIALERRIAATGTDRIEKEKMDFHIRVYEGYKKVAQMYPERIKTINADGSIDNVFNDVTRFLDSIV